MQQPCWSVATLGGERRSRPLLCFAQSAVELAVAIGTGQAKTGRKTVEECCGTETPCSEAAEASQGKRPSATTRRIRRVG